MSDKKTLIVLSNFRLLPFFAVLDVVFKRKRQDINILCTKAWIGNCDYGEFLPSWLKKLELNILNIITKVVVLDNKIDIAEYPIAINGINSSLKSMTLDSRAKEEKYTVLYNALTQNAEGAIAVIKYLEKIGMNNIFEIIVFNGRGAAQFAVVHFAHQSRIKTSFIEYGFDSYSGYKLFPYPPHASGLISRDIIKIAQQKNWIFGQEIQKKIESQILGKLNNPFEKALRSTKDAFEVVVFLGSDHEYTGIDEEICQFKVQGNYELVKYAINKYAAHYSVAVRAHPNQVSDPSHLETNANIVELCKKNNIVFFQPDSRVSSHHLIRNCKLVVVEYSSIAYDAVYLGKKVDIIGSLDLKTYLEEIPVKQDNMHTEQVSFYVAALKELEIGLHFVEFSKPMKALCFVLHILSAAMYKFKRMSSKFF